MKKTIALILFILCAHHMWAQSVNGFHLKFPVQTLPHTLDVFVWDKKYNALSQEDYIKFVKGKFENPMEFEFKAYPIGRLKLGSYTGLTICLENELTGKQYYLFIYSAVGEFVRSQLISYKAEGNNFQTAVIEKDLKIRCYRRQFGENSEEFYNIHYQIDGSGGYIKEILNQKE